MMVPDWTAFLRWEPEFRAVIDARYHTTDWLGAQLLLGKARMWTSANAAIIAEIRHYPTGAKDVHGLIAAGDLAEIADMIPLAEAWGREQGCIGAIIESREGWVKALRSNGYELYQTAVRKELNA